MSEKQENNNDGAVTVQPVLGNDGHSNAPSIQGTGAPTPSAPSGGIASPPVQETGDVTPPAGGNAGAFPDLADYATGLFEGWSLRVWITSFLNAPAWRLIRRGFLRMPCLP